MRLIFKRPRRTPAGPKDEGSSGARSLFRLPMTNRMATRVTAEWLGQHAVEPKLKRVAELLNTDRHLLMTRRRLGFVGAEQAIPPRQVETKVTVGLAHQDRVVNAMHVRRDDKPPQHAIDPRGDAHVRVIEHRG